MPKRILIADDHESVLRRVRAMLESQPAWEVCGEAVNGREAVAKAVQLKPDLVVLDFAMPQLDGLKTASEIHELLPGLPIMMFTMYGAQVKPEAQKHGISRVVDKTESGALMTAFRNCSAPRNRSLRNLRRSLSVFQNPHLTQILRKANPAPSPRQANRLHFDKE